MVFGYCRCVITARGETQESKERQRPADFCVGMNVGVDKDSNE